MISKKVILPMAAVGVIAAAAIGIGVATAETTDSRDSLVQKISDKFKLNKSEVQAVFDEHKTEKHAQREARLEERLTQAVKDGDITEKQKTAILAKHKELAARFESEKDGLKDKTPEERRAAMQSLRTELDQWAKDNDIDTKWLKGFVVKGFKGGHGHGPGGHFGPRGGEDSGPRGGDDSASPSPSPTAS
ncbi:MAG: hypothetical protein K0S68_587 [Candidatus Saccharibacteria bacterium]|nr:hypothetical protein [Candidatus Saccharibacteria bacterium]